MNPERFRQLEEAFTRAVEATESERTRILADLGAGDPALHAEVEALLAHRAHRPDFIETPALGPGFQVRIEPEDSSLGPGAAVGPYRIVRRVGVGGMGVVYEAVRQAPDFTQRVALKLIKRGMDTDQIVRRFQDERGVLARLDHPGIARLIDGGATEDGRPWLAMEFVEGEPLGAWCDARRLDLPARLRLFLLVCDAASAAHRRFVVHRDLKPANILVTDEGVPKLLDFGIAKMIDPGADSSHTKTEPASRMMTPEYTAPEIISGDAVSTAADVYSLGVILYELLCGSRPFRLKARSMAEAERIILETEADAPSSTLRTTARRRQGADDISPDQLAARRSESPQRLRRRLCGDLDNIVLKAIARDPAARYQTVPELAEDLRRYLHGRPVEARPPTLAYRSAKFARRHWALLTASAIAAASLLALVLGVSWQARIAISQRNAAILAADQAEHTTRFLQHMIESVEPGHQGPDVPMRQALDLAAARIDAQLTEHPLVRAAIHTTLGRAYISLGEYTSAEHELRDALALYRSARPENSPEVATALGELGTALFYHEEHAEAEALLHQSLVASRAAYGPRSLETAQALNNLGAILRNLGDPAEARQLHEEALDIRRELLGNEHLDTAESLNNLSATMRTLGRHDEARALLEESLEIRAALLPEDHPLLMQSQSNLAATLLQSGEPDDLRRAEAIYTDVIARMEAAMGPHHPDLAYPLLHLSRLLRQTGRPQQAEPVIRRAESVLRAALHPGDWRLLQSQLQLADLLTELHRYEEAEAVLQAAEQDLTHPDADRKRGEPYLQRQFVTLYEAWDRPEEAAKRQPPPRDP